jgi:hypothetical protein
MFSTLFGTDLSTFPNICSVCHSHAFHYLVTRERDLLILTTTMQWFDLVKSSLKRWDEVQQPFQQWVSLVFDRREKQKAHRDKLKKHGKDAAGGNRAPDILHTVVFNKPPAEIFHQITTESIFKELTASNCSIVPKPGGSFSLYDGMYVNTHHHHHHLYHRSMQHCSHCRRACVAESRVKYCISRSINACYKVGDIAIGRTITFQPLACTLSNTIQILE